MAIESSPSAVEFMSDDDISLNSSDSDQEEEYTVEEIIAERTFDDLEPRYLVKWENYGEERCDYRILIPVHIRVLFDTFSSSFCLFR